MAFGVSSAPRTRASSPLAQSQVKLEALVELGEERSRHDAYAPPYPAPADAAQKLDLGFAVLLQAGLPFGHEELKGVNPLGVASQRDHHDTAAMFVGLVVGDEDSRTNLIRFGLPRGLEVHQDDVAAP